MEPTAIYTTQETFSSSSEFARRSLELYKKEQPELSYRSSHIQSKDVVGMVKSITTGACYDAALNLMQKASEQLTPQKGRIMRPTIGHGVQGSSPSVGRAVTGNPRSMHRRELKHVQAPLVKIALSIEASANVGKDEIANRAAAVLSVLRKLESEGKRVQLSAYFTIPSTDSEIYDQNNHLVTINLKRAEQRLSVKDLSWLAHDNFLRGLAFTHFEHSEHFKICEGGYGCPQKFTNGLEGFDVTLNSILGMKDAALYTTPQKALEGVQQQFTQQLTNNKAAA